MTAAPGALSIDQVFPAGARSIVAGFESTHLPAHGVDVAELTGHTTRWRDDVDAVLAAGVRHFRYPLRWPRIEAETGRFDWAEPDRILGHLRDQGAVVVADLVHHTSYPRWITGGFADPRFGAAFVRYGRAVADRYPWLLAYTVFNEPFATLFLAGHEALWPPYHRGDDGFAGLLTSVLPAVGELSRWYAQALPDAVHVWVDTAEHHRGVRDGHAHAAMANDRRHVVLDLVLGHDLRGDRPYLQTLRRSGGASLLDLEPAPVDVLGLDYYCHSEWFYDERGGHAPPPHPIGFAAVAQYYAERYRRPVLLTETNIRGFPSDRASWLKYVLQEYEDAVARGVDLRGLCWFPQVDSCDWDSLLARPGRRVDPVGVWSIDSAGGRRATSMTRAWALAAAGRPSADLPAYRLQEPCASQLSGYGPAMSGWSFQDPPVDELHPPIPVSNRATPGAELSPREVPAMTPTPATSRLSTAAAEPNALPAARIGSRTSDLVVLSHLRWDWVWQRPQHLVSRMARTRAAAGARTWFVEEPVAGPVGEPTLRHEERDGIVRVRLEVPPGGCPTEHLTFGADGTACYGELLSALVTGTDGAAGAEQPDPDVWLYTPMALETARALAPGRLVFDVMDDLAAFQSAPAGLKLAHRRALTEADLVFTGGRSLDRGVRAQRTRDVHLFPSGVDTGHYAASRALRAPHPRPVAGYVGVVDERLDLDLLAGLARELPDWEIRVVGPVAKIDPADLPAAPNLCYAGPASYSELPAVMAGFDVALMPFALNEATRSISPTKSLEYLAAGLPVVSTPIADVVADLGDVVDVATDAVAFAAACRSAVAGTAAARRRRATAVLAQRGWDRIAETMHQLLEECRTDTRAATDRRGVSA
ncbi:glycosyltransferase [Nakamurella endophytica]|uniref:Glycosyltransferase involved in cell wall biosynthesis n=1 Tax=Nakamurella endophytica TaxID=1748367 RepID=A0A917T3E7_9ACTN|nr:glycosyltransferase [Nakamurella endophytica]GGM08779.1 hypothetical protein GCM10011594_30860 [Nakamurella endophytica]